MKENLFFDKILNYDQSVPICQLSTFTKLKWASQFLYNFTLRIDQNSNNVDNSSSNLKDKIVSEFKKKHKILFEKPLSLPEVKFSILSKKEFAKWRSKVNMPIVFRGFIKDSQACKKWSKEWLTYNYGDKLVQCIPPNITSLIGEEVQLKEVSISDFCNLDEYNNYYINNHHLLFKQKDYYESCNGKKVESLRGMRHLIDQWFISRSNQTGSSLHCANGDNMFLNIKGRKEWYFIDPTYTPLLNPILSKYGIYAVAGVEKILLNNWDSISDKYPYFKFIPVYRVVLQEGDVLFNPPWWWHSVRNLDDFTLGCATRYLSPGKASNVPVFHLGQMIEAIRHPIKSIYPQTLYMLLSKRVNKGLIHSIFSKN